MIKRMVFLHSCTFYREEKHVTGYGADGRDRTDCRQADCVIAYLK